MENWIKSFTWKVRPNEKLGPLRATSQNKMHTARNPTWQRLHLLTACQPFAQAQWWGVSCDWHYYTYRKSYVALCCRVDFRRRVVVLATSPNWVSGQCVFVSRTCDPFHLNNATCIEWWWRGLDLALYISSFLRTSQNVKPLKSTRWREWDVNKQGTQSVWVAMNL
jgi:hypothetical protein